MIASLENCKNWQFSHRSVGHSRSKCCTATKSASSAYSGHLSLKKALMSSSFNSRFFNPLMLWTDVALKTQEMLLSSGSVIQIRTGRMAKAGLAPSADDLAEMQLMGQEKLTAVSESGAAIANQIHTASYSLAHRAMRHWLSGATAWIGLATSLTPAQAAAHSHELFNASHRAVATATQLSSAGARVAQRGLKPIHAKATANARRLGVQADA